MSFDSTVLIILLTVGFVVIGISTSLIYYFARYYFKTDENDKELLTKKPLELGLVETKPSSAAPPEPNTVARALAKTRSSFWQQIKNTLAGQTDLSKEDREKLEEILFTNDLGPNTAELLLSRATQSAQNGGLSAERVQSALKLEIHNIFQTAAASRSEDIFKSIATHSKPCVWMIAGVNGVGKTTTIGKLAAKAKSMGLKTLIVAGDTFRAAADQQLKEWAERAEVEYFSSAQTKDPSAVAYSGLEMAKSNAFDLVIVDTAGRLHTQEHLMEELKKMVRVMKKIIPDAPHERLIVLDANSGQNALQQAREFNGALDLTGSVVSKLDGSSKGGVTVGIAHELKIPICFIGIGEKVEDLRPFSADEYVDALIQ